MADLKIDDQFADQFIDAIGGLAGLSIVVGVSEKYQGRKARI
ncbi:MAG: hypothetical protein SFT94_01735 [Pseudanabaenaceae cyanobacterium bins.68]|nr:hypothetical protein [Pseudanabaenaceae cyanobacterium bins.68]